MKLHEIHCLMCYYTQIQFSIHQEQLYAVYTVYSNEYNSAEI